MKATRELPAFRADGEGEALPPIGGAAIAVGASLLLWGGLLLLVL